MTTTLRTLLSDQIDFYWQAHLWPRLQGLTDAEYWWEPVEGAWSLSPDGDGVVRGESVVPEPAHPPVTTIAWRLAHVGRDVWANRARAIFGPSPAPEGVDMFDPRHWPEPLPLTARGGLELLEVGYTLWRDALDGLDDDALLRPLGPVGGPFAEQSLAALVMHLNREAMAHGAEICLLRDLYRAQGVRQDGVVAAALAGRVQDLVVGLGRDGGVGDLPDRHPSLLAEVAAVRRWDVLRALVDQGFPVDAPDALGATALHYAAAAGRVDQVSLLLEHGAPTTVEDDRFSASPARWAEQFGHTALVDRLDGHGRDKPQ